MRKGRHFLYVLFVFLTILLFQNCQNSEPVAVLNQSSVKVSSSGTSQNDLNLPACQLITDKGNYVKGEDIFVCLLNNETLSAPLNGLEWYGAFNGVDDITPALELGQIADRSFDQNRVTDPNTLPNQLKNLSGFCFKFATGPASAAGTYSRWVYGLYETVDAETKLKVSTRICRSNLAIVKIF